MNTPIKLAIGLGTVGGTVGAGVAIHQQLTAPTKDIRNKLISEGYQVLEDSSDFWGKILSSYADTVSENNNSNLKFENFDGKQAPNSTAEKLREKCKEVLDSKDLNENNFKKAIKWCTKPRTFSEILTKQGYRVLSIKDNDDTTDKTDWNNKIVAHNKKDQNTDKRFKELDGSAGSDTLTPDNQQSREKIKKQCKLILEKYHYEKDYQSILEKSTFWCAIKNA